MTKPNITNQTNQKEMKKFRIENVIDACLDMGMNRKKIKLHLKSQGLKESEINEGIDKSLFLMQEKFLILNKGIKP